VLIVSIRAVFLAITIVRLKRPTAILGNGRMLTRDGSVPIGTVTIRVLNSATNIESNGTFGAVTPVQCDDGCRGIAFKYTTVNKGVLVPPSVIPSNTGSIGVDSRGA